MYCGIYRISKSVILPPNNTVHRRKEKKFVINLNRQQKYFHKVSGNKNSILCAVLNYKSLIVCGVNTKVVELFSQFITLTFQISHVTAEELGNTKKIKIFSKLRKL